MPLVSVVPSVGIFEVLLVPVVPSVGIFEVRLGPVAVFVRNLRGDSRTIVTPWHIAQSITNLSLSF